MSVSAVLVALRKESVDRNPYLLWQFGRAFWSLSARRAWIEIAVLELIPLADPVALRKESVDRNRAYIMTTIICTVVALRKESVDRNITALAVLLMSNCRSPQGERG